jgi:tryptophan-rich sensory protein
MSDAIETPWHDRIDRSDVLGGVVAAVVVNVVGATPAILGGPRTEWFEALAKPALFPPTWAFGVVWTLLFTLMGIASYLVYREGLGNHEVRVALGLFVVQMCFNVAWTPTFFLFQEIGLALGVIVALFALLLPTTWAYARVDRRAGALLVPYLAWVAFAALLNYQFLGLN